MNNPKQSAKTGKRIKPKKPYADYPLYAHNTGRWAKKINGQLHYFGPWEDPDGALNLFLHQRDDLYAGREPTPPEGAFTMRVLANAFLNDRLHRLETGEITQRTFDDYHRVCKMLIEHFGKNRLVEDIVPRHFNKLRAELAKGVGPVTLGNEVSRVRVIFNFAYKAGHVDAPIRFGPSFKRPSKRLLRQARAERGLVMFEANQIQQMLDASSGQVRAMVWLGINCGFGNSDCAQLPQSALDLDDGWVNFPRPKTGVPRRCPLWSETVRALKDAMFHRPEAKEEEYADRVFITKYGQPWAKDRSASPLSTEVRKILKSLKIHRQGIGFYALRHTFETIGGDCRDQVAVDYIMGHVRDDMASVYRERISDERLHAVTGTVKAWLDAAKADDHPDVIRFPSHTG